MTKKDLVDYIFDTPQNINPAILNQMLDEVSGGSSEGDYDWDEAYELPIYQEDDNFYFLKKDIDIIENRLPHLIIFISLDKSRINLILIKSHNEGVDFGYIFQDDNASYLEKNGSKITIGEAELTLKGDRYISGGK